MLEPRVASVPKGTAYTPGANGQASERDRSGTDAAVKDPSGRREEHNMQVNPVGGGPPQVPQKTSQAPESVSGNPPAAQPGGTQNTDISQAAGAASSSTLSISASETSFSSQVSTLIANFSPFTGDQDLLRLLLLLIVLELLKNENGDEGQGGGSLMLQSESTSGSTSNLQITESTSQTSYALSVYNQQNQGFASPSPNGPAVEPGPAGEQGRNLDLQA